MLPLLVAAAIAAAVFVPAAPVAAQRAEDMRRPEVRWNQVELQAEAQREVDNDLMTANLYVEQNEIDPVKLAAGLNRALNDALAIARDAKGVRARSGGYNTSPVYDRAQRLTGWRGRAEIRLESRDFAAASALIGRLQGSMQLGGIQFGVSPELRRKTGDELMTEAIGAFRGRADIARAALSGKGYRIRQIAVNTGGGFPQPRPQLMARAMAAESVPAPQLEGGTSLITVTVSGSVEVD